MSVHRNWSKYLNSQKYSECQLITALNAYYYLTGKVYCTQDSPRYEELVDLSGTRHGTAINIEKRIHEKLGLQILGYSRFLCTGWVEWYELSTMQRWKKEGALPTDVSLKKNKIINLPIEINLWHKRTGFHSALLVEHCTKAGCFRIANFRHATSLHGWMFAEDLYQFTDDCNKGWLFRLFELK
jgi:hypothetical protein